jgi:hypothetical protein
MRVLVTSSRMPFALDAIRKLGERGHQVFACDSYEASPGSHSHYLAGHFVTCSPSGDPEGFAADVERIAADTGSPGTASRSRGFRPMTPPTSPA